MTFWLIGAAHAQPIVHEVSIVERDSTDALDYFGWNVGLSGTTALIGAWGNDGATTDTGAAYLFDIVTGDEMFKLQLAGAPGNNGSGAKSGAAYLFDAATGDQLHKLVPDDVIAGERCGAYGMVDLDAGIAIVGCSEHAANGPNSGAAYLFDVATGNQLRKLTPDDPRTGHLFGGAVAISGSLAIVGAFGDNDLADRAGAAYIFDVATGNQLAKLTPSDGDPETDQAGSSVAIEGTVAYVGSAFADFAGPTSGAVFVYDATTGTPLGTLLASDGAVFDSLGFTIAPSNGRVLTGAHNHDGPVPFSGAAYIFASPTACFADRDWNGTLNIDDIDAFIAGFLAADSFIADCDGNGALNVDDIDCFIASFISGCL